MKKMKRFVKRGLAVATATLMVVALAACSPPAPANTETGGENAAQGDVQLTHDGKYIFATGGTSGTYYPLGGAIAALVDKNNGTSTTAQSTGASKENIMLVSKAEADFAIVQNDVLDYADKGVELFDGTKVSGISTVASIYPEVVQIVVAADSGINTVADLKGKKVSIGDAGSGVEANALQVLDAYGLTTDDLQVSRLSFKESGNSFKDGALDAFFVTAGVPNTAVVELAVTRKLKLLNVDGTEADKMIATYPFYTKITIPKDVYSTEEDVNTIAVKALIICSDKMSEGEIYNFTKAIYDNLDALGQAHAKGKEFKLEQATEGVTVALHPGAKKYFDEKGVK